MRSVAEKSTVVALVALSGLLALVIACGGAAPEEGSGAQPAASDQQAAEPTAVQPAPQQQAATAVSIATPDPTPEGSAVGSSEQPAGTLNVGQKELGPFTPKPRGESADFRPANRSNRRIALDGQQRPGGRADAGPQLGSFRRRFDLDFPIERRRPVPQGLLHPRHRRRLTVR